MHDSSGSVRLRERGAPTTDFDLVAADVDVPIYLTHLKHVEM